MSKKKKASRLTNESGPIIDDLNDGGMSILRNIALSLQNVSDIGESKCLYKLNEFSEKLYYLEPIEPRTNEVVSNEAEEGSWEDIQRITDVVNLSVSEILEAQALAMTSKKKYKRYYIPKNPFPRILKKDFRRDFATMFQNMTNSTDSSMITSFFSTFAIPDFEIIMHNPMFALGGMQPFQQKRGFETIVPLFIRRVQSLGDMVLMTESVQIIQREGEIGSKIVAKTSVKATQVIIPNPNSIMKLDTFFCTCHFLDRQKLKILKTLTELRAKYVLNSYNTASPITATISQIFAIARESFNTFPTWWKPKEEAPTNEETKATTSCTANKLEEFESFTSSGTSSPQHNTIGFANVEVLIHQMQLFYESLRIDRRIINSTVSIEEPIEKSQQHNEDSSISHTVAPDHPIESNTHANAQHISTESPVKKKQKQCAPTEEGEEEEGRTDTPSVSSSSSSSLTSSETPVTNEESKRTSDHHHNSRSTTTHKQPKRPPTRTHFFNFQQEPVFVVCETCGRNKFPNTTTLQALAKPFLLRCALHPVMTFYFNEKHYLIKIEIVIPIEPYGCSLDLPAV